MKKITFLASLALVTGFASAQITQSNEPTIGASINLYVIDTLASEMDNVTGSGVTWDYSMYGGYGGNLMKTLQILDPASTPNGSSYNTSTVATSLQDGLTRFSNSTSTGASSQGYVFNEVTFGEVKLILDGDEAQIAAYPMNLGDQVNDPYSGTLHYSLSGSPQTSTTIGNIKTTFDGEGTLKLADGNDYLNVKRIKTVDSATAAIQFLGNATLVRKQYDYYHYATSNLPIFSIVYFKMSLQGSPNPITDTKIVLSSILPTGFVGVEEENCASCETKVYPNPASNYLNVSVAEDANVSVFSMTGQEVLTTRLVKGSNTKIDVSEFNQGVYLVKIEGATTHKIERVVIQ